MIYLPKNADYSVVIDAIRDWLGFLVAKNYQKAFDEVGYLVSFDSPKIEEIKNAIETYRNDYLFPGEDRFSVTDWREARGGDPLPVHSVSWYLPNSIGCAGAVIFDLPLNGKWSDLQADFVLFDSNAGSGGFILMLEEISKSS